MEQKQEDRKSSFKKGVDSEAAKCNRAVVNTTMRKAAKSDYLDSKRAEAANLSGVDRPAETHVGRAADVVNLAAEAAAAESVHIGSDDDDDDEVGDEALLAAGAVLTADSDAAKQSLFQQGVSSGPSAMHPAGSP